MTKVQKDLINQILERPHLYLEDKGPGGASSEYLLLTKKNVLACKIGRSPGISIPSVYGGVEELTLTQAENLIKTKKHTDSFQVTPSTRVTRVYRLFATKEELPEDYDWESVRYF